MKTNIGVFNKSLNFKSQWIILTDPLMERLNGKNVLFVVTGSKKGIFKTV